MQSPHHHHHHQQLRNELSPPQFHSTVAAHKLKRFNSLILLFRLAAFSFSLASSVFMLTNTRRTSETPTWFRFDAFRFVFVANAIVAIYSLFEMAASVWEISRETTLFPEAIQVWFDFGHDQVFAYLSLSANSAGASLARTMRDMDTCKTSIGFCIQSDISVAFGFVGFLFLGFSCLLSGYRVVCFIINGSRLHL